jgi:hypothetical protein
MRRIFTLAFLLVPPSLLYHRAMADETPQHSAPKQSSRVLGQRPCEPAQGAVETPSCVRARRDQRAKFNSGHVYLTQDDKAVLNVMWRTAQRLKYARGAILEVICTGRFPPTCVVAPSADRRPHGLPGAWRADGDAGGARRSSPPGLFDAARRRILLPRRIGVVTSPTGR